ncbi:DUF1510 family protein [Bacillus sp. A301a_S52]|jgi:hypothetical protein|nr:DUF1510 family protein [Bacillus sp. A301a_S52]
MSYNDYTPMRSDNRKKKKLNIILNVSIGLVALLIIVVGGTLFFSGGSEEATPADTEQNQNENSNVDINESENEGGDISINTNESNELEETNEDNSDTDDNTNNDSDNDNESNDNVEDGEWGPIGTVQEEPFAAVYEKSHVNWDEMTRALQYATGLNGDEMTVWYIGNGGDHKTAVGTVSTAENKHNPYEVTLSWVEDEGWMPVSVEQKNSNPYINN